MCHPHSRFPHSTSRQVAQTEGQKLAEEHQAAWVETSAKSNTNVGESLIGFIRIVRSPFSYTCCTPLQPKYSNLSWGKSRSGRKIRKPILRAANAFLCESFQILDDCILSLRSPPPAFPLHWHLDHISERVTSFSYYSPPFHLTVFSAFVL